MNTISINFRIFSGVSHSDELIYLLNNTVYYETLDQGDPELQMSKLMTSIWSNFATYGQVENNAALK